MVWVKGELLDDFAQAHRLGAGQLDRAAQDSLFDRLDWNQRVWEKTPPAGQLLIARAQQEKAFCWLMLARDGSRANALSNWYNFHAGPIANVPPDDPLFRKMLIALARRLKPGISRMTVSPMRGSAAKAMLSAFRKSGWHGDLDAMSVRWTADVTDKSFAEYWAARPGSLRSTFKRKSAKAGLECGILTSFDDDAWAAYENVYAASWKPTEGSMPFLEDMARNESAQGTLRLGIALRNGEPIAAQLWTVENGVALIHKLAYRSDARDLSPGTILSEAMFRHVIDVDKVDTIDFGTGDDPYKADWMDHSEPLYRLTLFNPASFDGLGGLIRTRLAALVRGNRNS